MASTFRFISSNRYVNSFASLSKKKFYRSRLVHSNFPSSSPDSPAVQPFVEGIPAKISTISDTQRIAEVNCQDTCEVCVEFSTREELDCPVLTKRKLRRLGVAHWKVDNRSRGSLGNFIRSWLAKHRFTPSSSVFSLGFEFEFPSALYLRKEVSTTELLDYIGSVDKDHLLYLEKKMSTQQQQHQYAQELEYRDALFQFLGSKWNSRQKQFAQTLPTVKLQEAAEIKLASIRVSPLGSYVAGRPLSTQVGLARFRTAPEISRFRGLHRCKFWADSLAKGGPLAEAVRQRLVDISNGVYIQRSKPNVGRRE